MSRLATLAVLIAVLGACGGIDRPRDVPTLIRQLESPDTSERSWAVSELGRLRVTEAVPGFVGRLRDEDGGIRLYAIAALRELTGEDFGYRPFAPEAEREAAVGRWEAWLAAGGSTP